MSNSLLISASDLMVKDAPPEFDIKPEITEEKDSGKSISFEGDATASTKVVVSLPLKARQNQFWRDLADSLFMSLDEVTEGKAVRVSSSEFDFLIQGKHDLKSIFNVVQSSIDTMKASLPDNSSADTFLSLLKDVKFHSGIEPKGRAKIFKFVRTESVKEIISGSKEKTESGQILKIGAMITALIFLLN